MALVRNLSTGEVRWYSCSPAEAVVAAYAQEHRDWNTWDYGKKYQAKYTGLCAYCGDWAAFMDNREEIDAHESAGVP